MEILDLKFPAQTEPVAEPQAVIPTSRAAGPRLVPVVQVQLPVWVVLFTVVPVAMADASSRIIPGALSFRGKSSPDLSLVEYQVAHKAIHRHASLAVHAAVLITMMAARDREAPTASVQSLGIKSCD